MVAPGLQAPEAQVGRLDVLAYGGEAKHFIYGQKDAQQRADELRNMRGKVGGRETWRAVVNMKENEAKFRGDSARFAAQFGGGEAKIDSNKEPPEIKLPATPELSAIHIEARALIEKNAQILTYLEVLRAPSGERDNVIGVLKKSRIELDTVTKFSELRKIALDAILENKDFQKMYPEIVNTQATWGAASPEVAKRQLIEDVLAKDDRFQNRLSARMQEVYEGAQKLGAIQGNVEQQNATNEKQQAEDVLNAKVKNIVDLLRKQGIKFGTDDPKEKDIKDLLKATPNQVVVADEIARKALNCTLSEFQEVKELINIKALIDQEYAKVEVMRNSVKTPQSPAKFLANQANQTLPYVKEYLRLTQREQTLSAGTIGGLKTSYDTNIKPLLGMGLGVGTNATGMFEQFIGDSVAAQDKIQTKNSEIARLKTAGISADGVRSQNDRLLEEARLLTKLEQSLAFSIIDTMEDRYDEMIPLEQQRLEKIEKDLQEKQQLDLAKAVRDLANKTNDKWIKIDKATRKKTANRDNIKKDMLTVAYGEDKVSIVKRMLVEDAGIAKFKDPNGKDVSWLKVDWKTGTYTYAGAANAKQTAKIPEGTVKLVDELYKSEGGQYTDKLFRSFFQSRNIMDHGFLGDLRSDSLALHDHEWVMLEDKFGAEVTAAVDANSHTKQALDNLKAAGIIKSNFRLKFLLYLLLGATSLVGGTLLGGWVATGGIGAAATAIGAMKPAAVGLSLGGIAGTAGAIQAGTTGLNDASSYKQ